MCRHPKKLRSRLLQEDLDLRLSSQRLNYDDIHQNETIHISRYSSYMWLFNWIYRDGSWPVFYFRSVIDFHFLLICSFTLSLVCHPWVSALFFHFVLLGIDLSCTLGPFQLVSYDSNGLVSQQLAQESLHLLHHHLHHHPLHRHTTVNCVRMPLL